MAQINTAEEATEVARSFVKKHRIIAIPLKAVREDDVWHVELDVGPLSVAVARVEVDARTGRVMKYEMPSFPPF
ncbi:MAG: PepSY domain-containing protein [Chloroflexi bacterium]|nr:PepSY domain-containing protein [Chloroflexota bacterium]